MYYQIIGGPVSVVFLIVAVAGQRRYMFLTKSQPHRITLVTLASLSFQLPLP